MKTSRALAIIAVLALLGAGCVSAPVTNQPTANTNVAQTISWKQVKLGFIIRLPEAWRASEADAGGVSWIRIIAPNGSEQDPEAQVFVQSSTDMEGKTISSFDQWMRNGGSLKERLVSKSVADGTIVVDGVTLQKRTEDDATIAYYAQLETESGSVYFRYAYAAQHSLKSDLENTIRQMRFSPSADEFERARVIP